MSEHEPVPVDEEAGGEEDEGASFFEMIQEQYEDEIRALRRDVVTGMLDVADALDRFGYQTEGEVRETVRAIRRVAERSIHRAGGVQIPALGLRFNAEQHAANGTVPVESEELDGVVVEVLEPGYVLGGDFVLRPALVTVGLFDPAAEPADAPEETGRTEEPEEPRETDTSDDPDGLDGGEDTKPQN